MDRQSVERWWRQVVSGARENVLDHAARGVLRAGTLPFEAATRIRDIFYNTGVLPVLKLPVPVVSFGNITVGGTGKTPAVLWCASFLQDKGLRPGVASRGYNPGNSAQDGAPNDEAALIGETLPGVPHVCMADRATAGAALVKEHRCNVVILDDGFQHRRLHRTLDFLLIDALNPFGYGYMLPRGLLREPLSAVRRATAVIITRSNLVSREGVREIMERVRAVDPGARFAEAVHRPAEIRYASGATEEPEALRGRRVYAFCGIGNPHSFIMTLNNLGAAVMGVRTFQDHHAYTAEEVKGIFREARGHGAEVVVTTRKDRVKTGWHDGERVPLAELRVEFELTKGRETVEGVLGYLSTGGAERPA